MLFGKRASILQNIQRLKHILYIFTKYGFGYIIKKGGLAKHLGKYKRYKKINRELWQLAPEVRIRKILEELGPTFIKIGQILSTRPDLIPVKYCRELAKLQDTAPPVSYKLIKQRIKDELGSPPEKLFKKFFTTPIAAGSLAQVHLAILPNNKKVVVKVIKPGIEDIVHSDLEILSTIARFTEKHFKEKLFFSPSQVLPTLKKSLLKELDLQKEAKNIKKFRLLFKNSKITYIPEVYEKYTTHKILVIEYLEGIKIDDIKELKKNKINIKKIARNGAKIIFRQIFEHKFFHADPHPGNLLVLPDGRIALIDFGMIGTLDNVTTRYLIKMLNAVINRDSFTLLFYLKKILKFTEDIDENEFLLEIETLINEYYDTSLKEINFQEMYTEGMNIITKYKIKIPSTLFLLSKALVTVESIGKKLDPEFQVFSEITPFIEKFLLTEYSFSNLIKKGRIFSSTLSDILLTLPVRSENVLSKLEREELKIGIKHTGLESLIHTLHLIGNRLALSILSAFLILSSSIILSLKFKPLIFGYPFLSIAGYFLGTLLMVVVLIDVVRYKK